MPVSAWSKQTKRWCAARSGKVHETGVISDVESATLQTGGKRQQIFGADKIEAPIFRYVLQNRSGILALTWPPKNGDRRTS